MPAVKQRAGKTDVTLYSAEHAGVVKAQEVIAFCGRVSGNADTVKLASDLETFVKSVPPPAKKVKKEKAKEPEKK